MRVKGFLAGPRRKAGEHAMKRTQTNRVEAFEVQGIDPASFGP